MLNDFLPAQDYHYQADLLQVLMAPQEARLRPATVVCSVDPETRAMTWIVSWTRCSCSPPPLFFTLELELPPHGPGWVMLNAPHVIFTHQSYIKVNMHFTPSQYQKEY